MGVVPYKVATERAEPAYVVVALLVARAAREPWRMAVAGGVLALLTPLVLWHLPDGWPAWRGW